MQANQSWRFDFFSFWYALHKLSSHNIEVNRCLTMNLNTGRFDCIFFWVHSFLVHSTLPWAFCTTMQLRNKKHNDINDRCSNLKTCWFNQKLWMWLHAQVLVNMFSFCPLQRQRNSSLAGIQIRYRQITHLFFPWKQLVCDYQYKNICISTKKVRYSSGGFKTFLQNL